jgi:aryl-alcohol dehydrogenase-like predicted oxidoreductase
MGQGPNDVGLNRKHILAGIENSLRRLQTEYIDLYQVHCWDETTPLEETLSTLDTLVKSGKVRYVGVSNYTSWQVQKAIDMSLYNGWEPFVSLQALYNLLDRDLERGLLDVCEHEGLGIMCWSPLRGGWLTGKFRRGMSAPPDGTRVKVAEEKGWSESWSVYNTEHTWNIIDELLAVAEEVGKSPAQVALNWLLNCPAVTCPILGVRTMGQLEDNLGAAEWSLDEDQMNRLNAVSELPDLGGYPYNFIERLKRQ